MSMLQNDPGFKPSIFSVMSGLAAEEKALNLSQGFPDFDVPAELKQGLTKAVEQGANQYAPMPGMLFFREKIAEKLSSFYGVESHVANEITVCPGATSGIYTAITCTVNPGDEVILFDPAYDCYAPTIKHRGGKCIHIPLQAPSFRLPKEKLKAALSPKTKLIIINTPHNPTGVVWPMSDLEFIGDLIANTNIQVISDEVYEHITFDGAKHCSALQVESLKERTFAIFSFGKTYHATGWKMGYVVAPKAMTNAFRTIYQNMVFSAHTPTQYAYAQMMDNADYYKELQIMYQDKKDIFKSALKSSRFKLLPCNGTYFQLLDFSEISTKNDTEVAIEFTKKHKIASIPVSVFYKDPQAPKNLLRFCFAKQNETLFKAAEILCQI